MVPLAAFGLGAAALASWGIFGGLAMSGQTEFDDGMASPGTSGKTRKDLEALADSVNFHGAVANVSLAVATTARLRRRQGTT